MALNYSLLTLVASCLLVVAATEEEVNIGKFCTSHTLTLTSLSQVRKLIDQVRTKTEPLYVCDRIKSSILDLDEILEYVQAGKTSSLEFTGKLAEYHAKYIASDKNEVRDNIPPALRRFFISLCFQISADFKIQLINNLEIDTKKYITDDDYSTISLLDKFGATLTDSSTEITDFDDIILFSDLSEVASADMGNPIKMMIKVKTSELLRKLMNNCRNKFKPIYDKLIMPLIALSNMGYNYRGQMLKVELEELKKNPVVRQWYTIVQTCETFKAVEIFEASDTIVDDDRQAFTFISQEEAEKLRENQKSVTELTEEEKPIDYNPEAFHRDDLWIKDQDELNQLVAAYKANSSSAERVRNLILKKLMAKLKESIKSGKIFFFASEMVGGLAQGKSTTNVNEDLIEIVDAAVDESEDIVKINKLDGDVAGGKNIPGRRGKIIKKKDGSKLSKKLQKFTAFSILPSKWSFAWWLGCFLAVLIICVLVGAAGVMAG